MIDLFSVEQPEVLVMSMKCSMISSLILFLDHDLKFKN